VFAREPGSPWLKQAKPGIPVPSPDNRPKKPQADTGAGMFWTAPGVEIVTTYVPGGVPYQVQPGQARLVKAGSDLVFQMHYTANGKAAADRSRVGIVFAKAPPRERVRNMLIVNTKLHIPPGAPDHRVEARVTLEQAATLTSLFPHMHVRGKGFEYRAVYPTGETEVLLRVPRYNFNWQLTYFLDRPRVLPKGTRLECTAWFDNSPNNAANPDPKADVFWGDQSWEEMLAGFLDLAVDVGRNPEDVVGAQSKSVRPVD